MRRTTLLVLACSALAAACGDDGGNNPGVDANHMHLDGSGSATNHAPTIADVAITTAEDTAVTQAVPSTDPDGDTVTLTFGAPSHGTVTQAAGTVTYTAWSRTMVGPTRSRSHRPPTSTVTRRSPTR